MSAATTADFLSAAEQELTASNPPGFVQCNPCQDFRSDVSFNVEHPCRHCQPMRFLSWRLCEEGAGLSVIVDGRRGVVLLPPAGGPIVQPCEFPTCEYGCVLVEFADRDDTRWIELDHVVILTPWEGK